MFKNEKESFISEKQKLITLTEDKNEEIKRLYDSIKKIKETTDTERNELKSIIEGLRARLKEFQQSNAEETEHLKVKMAQLHRNDVESL